MGELKAGLRVTQKAPFCLAENAVYSDTHGITHQSRWLAYNNPPGCLVLPVEDPSENQEIKLHLPFSIFCTQSPKRLLISLHTLKSSLLVFSEAEPFLWEEGIKLPLCAVLGKGSLQELGITSVHPSSRAMIVTLPDLHGAFASLSPQGTFQVCFVASTLQG